LNRGREENTASASALCIATATVDREPVHGDRSPRPAFIVTL
jgi:hypothetical protein